MAYFNNSFSKVFVGTQTSGAGAGQNDNTNLEDGFITTAGIPTSMLSNIDAVNADNNYGPGSYGFFNPSTYQSVDLAFVGNNSCCPLILASASLLSADKIGPFHGGYQESNKSKMINPKYIQKAYKVETCTPQQAVVSIGNTPYTDDEITAIVITNDGATYNDGVYPAVPLTGGGGSGATADITIVGGEIQVVTIVNPGTGYTTGNVLAPSTAIVGVPGTPAQLTVTAGSGVNCCYEFLCGETYYLRIDIKGSPALRYLNHNAYQTLSAYTGCCADDAAPAAVDSTLVFIEWAKALVINAYLTPFVMPVVFDEAGVAWYAPGTTLSPLGIPVGPDQWWTAYVSPGHTADACAGMRLFGAYVDTKFGNCSFQLTDFYEKEPVKILASLVDLTGDPCTFEGLCVVTECYGVQGMGFGESVVRDLILSESYLQNFFATDIRIREITQGDQILNTINRNALYTRYYILHSVPRFNNPSGVFDNDRYMLEIISTAANTALETFLETWLDTCAQCVPFETESCTPCVIVAD